MGKLLEFPSQQAQGLAYLERELRRLLASENEEAVALALCGLRALGEAELRQALPLVRGRDEEVFLDWLRSAS